MIKPLKEGITKGNVKKPKTQGPGPSTGPSGTGTKQSETKKKNS